MEKEINQRAATVSPTRATVRVNGTQTFTINNTSATISRYSTTNGRMSVDDFTSKTVTITGRVEGEDTLIRGHINYRANGRHSIQHSDYN